jgi:hypothetical protein
MKNSKSEIRSQKSEINLHIAELVLHGFAPGDRHRISEAVQQELTRLISEQTISLASLKSISRDKVDGGAFHMANAAKPAAVGAQIAGAVLGGIPL